MKTRALIVFGLVTIALSVYPGSVHGQDALYFTAIQDARQPILDLIAAESTRIDVAAWWFTDAVISDAIVRRHRAGVAVRFIGDASAYRDASTRAQIDYLASQGIPIRVRSPAGADEIMHWKCGIFAGQKKVAFGSANWTVYSLRPYSSTNHDDETMLVTADQGLVPAFRMQFDRMWVDTTAFVDFANITTGVRVRLDPDAVVPASMIWGQGKDYNARLIAEIDAEQQFVDIVLYRLGAASVTDALVRRVQAGVPVRVVIDPVQYRSSKVPTASANLDRLWALSVPIKQRVHQGMTHMKTIVTSTVATNGSSNVVDSWQRDHNYFIDRALKPGLHDQLRRRVAAMYADTVGFANFRPQPPGNASLIAPANGASGVPVNPLLDWSDAAWATNYDVLLGTSEGTLSPVANHRGASQVTLGSSLRPSTRYYWRVRARTNATPRDATLTTITATWSFTTGGGGNIPPAVSLTAPATGATFAVAATVTLGASASDADGTVDRVEFFGNGTLLCTDTAAPYSCTWSSVQAGAYSLTAVAIDNHGGRTTSGSRAITVSATAVPGDVVLYAARAPVRKGAWTPVGDPGAAGGRRLYDATSSPTITTPASSPVNYSELNFMALAGVPYRLWMRGRADDDYWENDSVWVQFSGSLNAAGSPAWRIGSTAGISLSIEECSACGLAGWGWHDNGWGVGVRGNTIAFATSGVQTIRIQQRQDGISIDQIVLSPATYMYAAPGSTRNDTKILPEKGGVTAVADVVLRAATVPSSAVHGDWSAAADVTAAGRIRLVNPDRGVPKLVTASASPVSYFDVTFTADAGKPYHLWLRLRAEGDRYTNDSVFVQFSGSVTSTGTPSNRIGTTEAAVVSLENTNGAGVQGWGWGDNGWAGLGPHVYFERDGTQRIRIQVREDGVSIDQIVLSPGAYLTIAPGSLKNDATILP
jgi:hypothetical protein